MKNLLRRNSYLVSFLAVLVSISVIGANVGLHGPGVVKANQVGRQPSFVTHIKDIAMQRSKQNSKHYKLSPSTSQLSLQSAPTVVHMAGTLSSSQTWSLTNADIYIVDDTVIIPSGVTLTIEPGVIVKFSPNTRLNVNQGGILQVSGAAANPVIMTSIKDDSVGGDTNGDGLSVAMPGDYNVAINVNGGTVVAGNTIIENAQNSLVSSCSPGAAITVNDSVLRSTLNINGCDGDALNLARNQFAVEVGYAATLNDSEVSGFKLSGNDANTFIGTDQHRAVYMSSSRVDAGSTWTVDGTNAPVLVIYSFLNNGEAIFQNGVIIKQVAAWSNKGITVNMGAGLIVDGSSSAQSVMTSVNDDTIGGDSAGDGATIAMTQDYPVGIFINGGAVTISDVIIRSTGLSVKTWCTPTSAPVAVNGNTLNGQVTLYNCNNGIVSLQRNHFDLSGGSGSAIYSSSSDVSGIALSGANQNTFSGPGQSSTLELYYSSIAHNSTWNVDASSGAKLLISSLIVNGTVNIGPNMIVKESAYWGNSGFSVKDGGQLNVLGTATSPTVFTSSKDDSIGGDMNGDGASSVAVGDYPRGVVVAQGASVNLSGTNFYYAGQAIIGGGEILGSNVSIQNSDIGANISSGQTSLQGAISNVNMGLNVSGGDVTFRGSIHNVLSKSIQACNWNDNRECNVDATYTDWGSADGPNTANTQLVCGNVEIIPWEYNGVDYNGTNAFGSPNCNNSPTPEQNLDTSVTHFEQRVGTRQIDCGNGFQDACDAIHNAFACLGSAVNLAGSTSPIPLPQIHEDGSIDSWKSTVEGGATNYIRDSAIKSVLPSQLGQMFSKMMGVVGLYNSLSSAYNTCAP